MYKTNAAVPVPGFDIIAVAGEYNSIGNNGSISNTTIDIIPPDYPLFFWTTTLNPVDSIAYLNNPTPGAVNSAPVKLDCQAGTICGINFSTTFAKYYAANNLGSGRKILIVHGGYPNSGFTSTGTFTDYSGVIVNRNWLANGTTNLLARLNQRIASCLATSITQIATPKPGSTAPDGTLYDTYISNSAPASNNKLVAVLWQQGDTDAASPEATYKNNLEALRASCAINVPFIVGGLSPNLSAPGVKTALASYGTAYADSANAEYSANNLTEIGQRYMGQKYYEAWVASNV